MSSPDSDTADPHADQPVRSTPGLAEVVDPERQVAVPVTSVGPC
jgi:hypothetical protein